MKIVHDLAARRRQMNVGYEECLRVLDMRTEAEWVNLYVR